MSTFLGILAGLVILVARPFAFLAVALLAPLCRRAKDWPYFVVTPDDPYYFDKSPHWGHYEPTVSRIYERYGRIVGDIYWLGFRNVLYGLRYRLKPGALYVSEPARNYAHLQRSHWQHGPLHYWRAGDYGMIDLRLGKIKLVAGWKVDGIVMDPHTPRNLVNMDGRPMFSLRRAR